MNNFLNNNGLVAVDTKSVYTTLSCFMTAVVKKNLIPTPQYLYWPVEPVCSVLSRKILFHLIWSC